jgi:hypothetical protein
MSITDNLIYEMNKPGYEGNGRAFQIGGGSTSLQDVTISHNTVLGATNTAFTLTSKPTIRFVVTDNIIEGGTYGLIGDATAVGTASWTAFAPEGTFLGNVIVISAGYASMMPTGNSYPSTVAAVGFQNITANDYHLAQLSPYKGTGAARDPGADIDAVQAAVGGVVIP